MNTIWNVELLRTNENKYTIYFLSIEGSYQKIINDKHRLYELCKKLHDTDNTFWTIETISKSVPKEINEENSLKDMLEKQSSKL